MNQEASPVPAADRPTLSIVIPVYNELDTWRELLALVESVEMPAVARQIILVDDGSSDGTGEQLRQFAVDVAAGSAGAAGFAYKVIFQDPNQGKGAALRTGFDAADGEIVIIQDADMEYDPHDHLSLIQPILDGEADVVYGSRYREKRNRKGYMKNYLANRCLTGLSNLTTGLKLTDMETCYKVFRTSVLRQIHLEQNRFGFEPEITAKIAKLGLDIRELPISYDPRTHEAGKKIGWRDGLKAIWCILKYGLRRRAKKA